MSKRTYLPLLMDRWTAGTQELTFEQRGFYISLLVWMYDTGEAIKDSDHAARILRCDRRVAKRLYAELTPKFRRTSAGLRHKVLDNLIRNGGKIKGIDTINFPTVPDPIQEEEKNPPLKPPPKPKSKRRSPPPSASSPVVPDGICRESWDEYIGYRRENRMRPLKPKSQIRLMTWLVDQGPPSTQAAIVDQTVRNGWTGLFELKANGNERTRLLPKPKPRLPADYYNPDGTINAKYAEGRRGNGIGGDYRQGEAETYHDAGGTNIGSALVDSDAGAAINAIRIAAGSAGDGEER